MTFLSQDPLLTVLALVLVIVLILGTNELYLWQFRRRHGLPPRPRGNAGDTVIGDPD